MSHKVFVSFEKKSVGERKVEARLAALAAAVETVGSGDHEDVLAAADEYLLWLGWEV